MGLQQLLTATVVDAQTIKLTDKENSRQPLRNQREQDTAQKKSYGLLSFCILTCSYGSRTIYGIYPCNINVLHYIDNIGQIVQKLNTRMMLIQAIALP